MNEFTLACRTSLIASCLALVLQGGSLFGDQNQSELPPPVPADQKAEPPATRTDAGQTKPDPTKDDEPTTIMQYTVHEADPSQDGVFAPYFGKSPCGEFDVPYNDYFGDTRIYRSVVLGRLWFEGDYIGWQTKGVHLPALVTTSAGSPAVADAGVVGQGDTTVLFGDDIVHDTWRSGGRINFGYWFSPEHVAGLESHLLWVDGRHIRFFASSEDVPIIAHPTIAAGANDRTLVSFPGVQDGSTLTFSDMGLFSVESLWRRMVVLECNSRIDIVSGYRYMHLFDRLRTDDAFVSTDAASGFPVNARISRTDLFESKNDFHGGDLGLICRWWNCCWALQLTGKIALGATHTQTIVDGETVRRVGNTRTVTTGGILAQSDNIGLHNQQRFAAIGEYGARWEYACNPRLRLYGGYDIFWCSSVARAPDSTDLSSPAFAFQNANFWAHGFSFGGHYDF